jgi:peptidyl-prolyl cis-trans isomerase B (cyclophilin B)
MVPAPEEPAAATTSTMEEELKGKIAVIETNLGTIKFQFLNDKAPGHVKNFVDLAKKGFYDGTRFHRVIPGFMIQGGDPNSKSGDRSRMGTGDPGYKIKAEFNDTKHLRGIVSMARSPAGPDTAGCQFFICVATAASLDGQYTAFGKVVEGMDVVDKIVNLERDARDNPLEANPAIMKKVKIEEK